MKNKIRTWLIRKLSGIIAEVLLDVNCKVLDNEYKKYYLRGRRDALSRAIEYTKTLNGVSANLWREKMLEYLYVSEKL